MKIKRTANAGVLLELDGVSILLDGICGEVPPYIATPEEIREELYSAPPDIVVFTHIHTDHYDKDFALFFEKNAQRKILSPENKDEMGVGSVKIQSVDSRHIGRNDIEHISFVIQGSRCAYFMGDASPITLKKMGCFPKPDVLFVPFAYFSSESAAEITKSIGADKIVLLHMPNKENDDYKIWDTVNNFIISEQNIHILKIGETLEIY